LSEANARWLAEQPYTMTMMQHFAPKTVTN
jgi:hypothetical protein